MVFSPNDLAIFGGAPAFGDKLHVGRPNVGDKERLLDRISDIVDCRWLTNDGPYLREFEERLAALLGVRHCFATCNATTGLEILIRAAELEGEVILPSLTFVATAHALRWLGLEPVFCDVARETHNIDPIRVEERITPRTTAILGVHLWGRSCEVEALEEIARGHEVRLMFDAAHAFGCTRDGRMIGGFGDAEVFSFHATKFFNTFEGGAITTNDDALAEKVRLMRNFGFSGYDEVSEVGTNGKMHEASAAMGLTSLESLQDFVTVNHRNYDRYREGLSNVPGIRLVDYDPGESNNYQYITLEVDEEKSGIGRDELVRVLWAENILARRYFYPGCHRMEPYRSESPEAALRLPVTETLAGRLLTLPNGTAVGPDEVGEICSIIRTVVSNAADISRRLAGVASVAASGAGPRP